MKLIIVARDEQARLETQQLLTKHQIEVSLCDTLFAARNKMDMHEYDMVVIYRDAIGKSNISNDNSEIRIVKNLAEYFPVVLVTDEYKQQEVLNAYDMGIIDYIIEPINEQDFINRLYLSFKRKHKIDRRDTLDLSLAHLKMSYDALFENTPDAIVHMNTKHEIVDVNPQFTKLFGYEQEEVIGRYINDIIDPLGKVNEYSSYKILAGEIVFFEDTIRYGKYGQAIPVMHKGLPLRINGDIIGGYLIYTDITDRKRAEKAVHDQLKFLQKLMDTIPNPVYYKNKDGFYLGCNKAFEQFVGTTKKDILGKTVADVVSAELATVYREKDNQLFQSRGTQTYEYKVHQNSSEYDVLFNKATYDDADGNVAGMVGIIVDITERKGLEENNRFLAYHDPLTGLLNTRSLHEQFPRMLENIEETNERGAVLFIDIDRFKMVNDSLGHHFGDLLLQEIADRFVTSIPNYSVFRPGGDEFIVLVTDEDQVLEVARTIIEEIAKPFKVIERELTITASIGISLYPQDGKDINTLFSNADTAMYRAKARGKNQYCYYKEEMNALMLENLTIENELRKALDNNELELYYQPQFDTMTEEIIGMEALIRWNNPHRGLIPPDLFIPLAEETGLILPIGNWVARQACYQNKKWQSQGLQSVPVAVNVSPLQFSQTRFIEDIESILLETGLDPQYLDIEITESTAMSDIDEAIKKVTQLREMGIQVSIDDFGTGYSSLGNFRRLPINKLKIDRSFIDRILIDGKDAAIVDTIIAMAQKLGLGIIAEGVETREHMLYLQNSKCNNAQGYLYSKPLKAHMIEKMLRPVCAL